MPPALQFLVLTFAGWVNRHQDDLIAYLREENRVLREHLGPRPLRLTDAQRRRLAVRGQKLGRRVWMQVAGIVTPDTILRWYRRLIAQTYDGSARRGRGRPMTRRDVAGRWLLATRPLSDARPRPARPAGFWRDPGGRGVQPIRLPPKSPNLNAYAERFVRSMKEECLSRVVPLGEGHLRLLVGEYVDHDHRERNHQGLDNQLLQRPSPPVSLAADVQRRERLGGLLNFYHREAA